MEINNIKSIIELNYGIRIDKVIPERRGYYGITYKIISGDKQYFSKTDIMPFHYSEYINSLEILNNINQILPDIAPKVIHTTDDKLFTMTDEGITALTEYINGVHTEDYPVSLLFSRLAKLYTYYPEPDSTDMNEIFSCSIADKLNLLVTNLSLSSNEYLLSANDILGKNSSIIKHVISRMNALVDKCKNMSIPIVMTHGDAGGNCIVSEDFSSLKIIDWDTACYSIPERDAWFFLPDKDKIHEINSVFVDSGLDYCINLPVCAYFAYRSFIQYITEYLTKLHFLAEKGLDNDCKSILSDFYNYFKSSWILEQLKIADTITD